MAELKIALNGPPASETLDLVQKIYYWLKERDSLVAETMKVGTNVVVFRIDDPELYFEAKMIWN